MAQSNAAPPIIHHFIDVPEEKSALANLPVNAPTVQSELDVRVSGTMP